MQAVPDYLAHYKPSAISADFIRELDARLNTKPAQTATMKVAEILKGQVESLHASAYFSVTTNPSLIAVQLMTLITQLGIQLRKGEQVTAAIEICLLSSFQPEYCAQRKVTRTNDEEELQRLAASLLQIMMDDRAMAVHGIHVSFRQLSAVELTPMSWERASIGPALDAVDYTLEVSHRRASRNMPRRASGL